MTTPVDVLKPVKKSPLLPKLLEELQWFWQDEQLRRKEFYEWLTPNVKAEWIEGEIIIHSPVSLEHNRVTGNLFRAISIFTLRNEKKSYVGIEKILTRFSRNDYEPDICYYSAEKAQKFYANQNVFPVPDFIVEVISKSTEKHDRETKFADYELHRVKEYWIIDPIVETIEQYILQGDKYELQENPDGQVKSTVIKGLVLPKTAIFDTSENAKWIEQL